MQSQSRQSDRRQKIALLVAALVVVLFVVAIIFSIVGLRSNGNIDQPSGETISSPKGRQDESYGVGEGAIVYYGISELTRAGVSDFMVDTFRTQMSKYSSEHSDYIKTVSVYVKSLNSGENNGAKTLNFDILINQKDRVKAQLKYEDLSSVTIILKDSLGKQLFSSGLMTQESVEEDNYTGDGVPPEQQ